MKKLHHFTLLVFSVFLFSCEPGVQAPKEFLEARKADLAVKKYESFSEINTIQPIPAKLDLGAGALIKIIVLRDGTIRYTVVPPSAYSNLEKSINSFYSHPGLQKSLGLLSYARQLKANHPYRINPFVPYLTHRPENNILGKTGPAALVADLIQPKGAFEGVLAWRDPKGVKSEFSVRLPASLVPMTGMLLLFDHDIFSIDDLVSNPEKNLLQDVIVHEFTHIWHLELLDNDGRSRQTVESNKSQVGHDTMIVTNPAMAFSEGLAIAFEALYGTTSSLLMNMSPSEREEFFGRRSAKLKEDLEFLVNRQVYVRKNSYLYNLYDFANCTLRLIKAIDSADIGKTVNTDRLMARILNGEDVDISEMINAFSWQTFEKRFYANADRVSAKTLRDNCQVDSPSRLESKEGFVASLIYNLIASGALVADEELAKPERSRAERLNAFRTYASNDVITDPKLALFATSGRDLASNAERLKRIEKNFLLGFRGLASGVLKSQATTLKDFLGALLSPDSEIGREQQIRVAFEVLRMSEGAFMAPGSHEDRELQMLFRSPQTIRWNLQRIYDRLDALYTARELDRVIGRLGEVPAIYVEFKSSFGGAKRLNVNLAHHIELIDMFGGNSKAIHALAGRLDSGKYFRSEIEFLDFAKSIGKGGAAAKMLDDARISIEKLGQLDPKKMLEEARSSALKSAK